MVAQTQDQEKIRALVDMWNKLLETFAKEFHVNHKGITTTIYDTSVIFNTVLDEPKMYGYKDSISECREERCFWKDDIHPASEFHRILALYLAMFLDSI